MCISTQWFSSRPYLSIGVCIVMDSHHIITVPAAFALSALPCRPVGGVVAEARPAAGSTGPACQLQDMAACCQHGLLHVWCCCCRLSTHSPAGCLVHGSALPHGAGLGQVCWVSTGPPCSSNRAENGWLSQFRWGINWGCTCRQAGQLQWDWYISQGRIMGVGAVVVAARGQALQ